MRLVKLTCLASILACAGLGKKDGDPVDTPEGDADADADADSDADADADTDTEPTVEEVCPSTTDLCNGSDCTLTADVPVWTMSGAVRYDGGAVPDNRNYSDDWYVWFQDVETASSFWAQGPSTESSWSAEVPDGTYDVWLLLPDSTDLPDDPMLVERALEVHADGSLSVDAAIHTVSGAVRYDGGAVPDNRNYSDDWYVWFLEENTGSSFWAQGPSTESSYSLEVPEGTYTVSLLLPDSTDHPDDPMRVTDGYRVSGDQSLTVDSPVHTLTGSVRYDGGAVPDNRNYTDDWYVWLYEVETGSSVYAQGPATESAWSAEVPEGTYDVYLLLPDSIDLPDDPMLVTERVAVTADATLNVDVPVYTLTGALRYDGGAVPDNRNYTDDWYVYFVEVDTGSTFWTQGPSTESAYALEVPEGRYDVFLLLPDSTDLPDDPMVVTRGLAVNADDVVNVDVPIHTLTGAVRLDGGAVPDNRNYSDDWYVYFTDVETGSSFVTQGPSTESSYTLDVPDGVYDVSLLLPDSVDLPDDPMRVASAVTIAADANRDVDVPLYSLTGAVRYDGGAVPDNRNYTDDWYVWLQDLETGSTFWAQGPATEATYSLLAPAGVYHAWLTLPDSTNLPDDPMRVAECVELGI